MLIRTNIYLPHDTLEKLKRKAKEQHTTVSELIRQSIEKEEYKYNQSHGAQGLLQLADKLSKQKFSKEKEVVISAHDSYLYEEYERERDEFLEELKQKRRGK